MKRTSPIYRLLIIAMLFTHQLSAQNDLTINEFLADNVDDTPDPEGEFDDWIEMYNKSSEPLDLTNFFLTDDIEDLEKWPFPAGTMIEGNGYLIVWADGQTFQMEGLHANFSLDKAGESLLLVDFLFRVVERIDFGPQQTDMSYSRIPNGTGDFVIKEPTFEANNEGPSNTKEIKKGMRFSVQPNPAAARLFLQSDQLVPKEAVSVYNLLGCPIYQESWADSREIDISQWPAGMYIVRVGEQVELFQKL